MKRHIGKLRNTDQRCVVVFMQIPQREDHALICSIDNLAPRFEQALMDVVESAEGQSDPVLAKVLNRRLVPDTGQNLLEALHQGGLLRAVPVDAVIMLPQPNMPFPLRQIIEGMGGSLPPQAAESAAADDKFNPHTANVNARSAEERRGIASNLLVEADLLQSEADRKREQAYKFAPELKPKQVRAAKAAESITITPAEVKVEVKDAKPKRARAAKKAGG